MPLGSSVFSFGYRPAPAARLLGAGLQQQPGQPLGQIQPLPGAGVQVSNPDGTTSSERTIGVGIDGREYIIPTLIGGQQFTEQQAIKEAQRRGLQNFPSFGSVEEANAYAQQRTNALGSGLSQGTAQAPPRDFKQQPMTPQEEGSLIKSIGRGGLSTAMVAVNTLDTPASAIRNVFAGKPHHIPQGLISLRSGAHRASGRDILERPFGLPVGMAPKNIPGFHPIKHPIDAIFDVAGLGLEIGMDPLTYLTLGGAAVSRVGKAIKAAGISDDTIRATAKRMAEAAGEGSAKHMGIRRARMIATPDEIIRTMSGVEGKAAQRQIRKSLARQGLGKKEIAEEMTKPFGGAFGFGLPFSNKPYLWRSPARQVPRPSKPSTSQALPPFSAGRASAYDAARTQFDEYDQLIADSIEAQRMGDWKMADQLKAKAEQAFEQTERLNTQAGLRGGLSAPAQDMMSVPQFGLPERFAGRMDDTAKRLREGPVGRFGRMLFHTASGGNLGKVDQKIAEKMYPDITAARVKSKRSHTNLLGRLAGLQARFETESGEHLTKGVVGRQAPKDLGWVPGDIVHANDEIPNSGGKKRDRFGRVMRTDKDKTTVRFRDPETGEVKYIPVAHKDVKLEALADSPEALAHGDTATREILERLVISTQEMSKLGGFDDAWEFVVGRGVAKPRPNSKIREEIESLAEEVRGEYDPLHEEFIEIGGDIGTVDAANYSFMPRAMERGKSGPYRESLNPRSPEVVSANTKGRVDPLATVPSTVVDHMLQNPHLRAPKGGNLDSVVGLLLDPKYERFLGGGWKDEIDKMTGITVPGKIRHARALAGYIQGAKKSHITAKRPLYTRMMSDSHKSYQKSMRHVIASGKAIHEVFDDAIREEADSGVLLKLAFEKVGMDPERAMKHFAARTGKSMDELNTAIVPHEVLDAAKGAWKMHQDPLWGKEVGRLIDTMTQAFKTHVTLPFPSFMTRNFGSGQFVNLVMSGQIHSTTDLKDYFRQFKHAEELAFKKNLTMGDQRLLDEISDWEAAGGHIGFEDAPTMMRPEQGARPGRPWEFRKTAGEVSGDVTATPSRLDAMPGGRGLRKAHGTYINTAAKANQHVEWMNRVPMYLYLRKRGFTPQAAAKKVHELQFDYSALTPFEKSIMKRGMPFYTFSRKIAGLTAKTLAERPGGALAQTMRASAAGYDPSNFVPEHIRDTAAIPLPPGHTGAERYLAGFGLAHEDPLAFTRAGVRGAGLEAMSRMNPLIKGPMEYFTGQSFFQRGPRGGRALDELDPTIGRIMSNIGGMDRPVRLPQEVEVIFANSPLSRYLTTTRQLTDTRKGAIAKGVNVLTGMRVADVPEKTQDAILREMLDERMRRFGARAYENVYFPKTMKAEMSPGDLQAAEEMQVLRNMLNKRGKARRKAEEEAALLAPPVK